MASSTQRHVLSATRRLAQPRRLAHTVSTVHPPEDITLPPIFDIFDVPSQLGSTGQGRIYMQPRTAQQPPQNARPSTMAQAAGSSSLPPPTMFDGPSRSRFSPHVRQVSMSASSRPDIMTTPQASTSNIPEIFDGPARLRRYSSTTQNRKYTRVSRFLLVHRAIQKLIGSKNDESSKSAHAGGAAVLAAGAIGSVAFVAKKRDEQ